jgi:hypothetical protein
MGWHNSDTGAGKNIDGPIYVAMLGIGKKRFISESLGHV